MKRPPKVNRSNEAVFHRDGLADTWLVDLPPTARQGRSAVAVAAIAAVGFAAAAPFAGRPLVALNALFPALDAIVFVTDLVTAVLLFAQYSISRSRSLLALATSYLFTAFIVVPHALTVAGAFTPAGLLGAGIQTGSWLFIFWHLGYAAGLLAYAGLRAHHGPTPVSEGSALPAIGLSLAGVVALVLGLTWLSTAGADLLPHIILDQNRMSPIVVYPIWFTISLAAAAIGVLLCRRRRSVLDQWLMVVALVFIAELVFSGLLPTVRFSLGFYAGRVFSIITSSIVLIVMLGETTRLYMRLSRANALLRQEHANKLMSLEAIAASISHEIRQPMAAISANSAATIRLLQRESPDLAEALSALKDIQGDSRRVNEILHDIRDLFGKGAPGHERIDLNDTAVAALRALRGALDEHGVSVRRELQPDVPPIVGHRSQLQEVITNLLQNALEAMEASEDHRRVLTVRTRREEDKAIVEVEDTGPGLDAARLDKVFEPFVTTKPGGMGLGLAICRTIVDRHGGQLSASPARPRGTVFRMVLPAR